MSNIVCKGPFKEQIQNFLELKQAIGYKYKTNANNLKLFDRFTLETYPEAHALTKEIVFDWCSKKTYEAQANQCSRASIIRQFGKYLDSLDYKAFIIPRGYYHSPERYIPHIYTADELSRFFVQTDKCQYNHGFPYRHLIMPVIFRMIYMCGLRMSEARLLKVADVDLEGGILTIHHSKKDKSRLVPMSDYLTKRCRDFSKKVHSSSLPEDYYFPALGGKSMERGNLYQNFRKFLWNAKISHRGKGYGPRIHDFRHSYAVHCLKKWVEEGKDLMAYLPILKTYMGHTWFEETAYYLHLTADVFPNIMLQMESRYSEIIPQLGEDIDEAY